MILKKYEKTVLIETFLNKIPKTHPNCDIVLSFQMKKEYIISGDIFYTDSNGLFIEKRKRLEDVSVANFIPYYSFFLWNKRFIYLIIRINYYPVTSFIYIEDEK